MIWAHARDCLALSCGAEGSLTLCEMRAGAAGAKRANAQKSECLKMQWDFLFIGLQTYKRPWRFGWGWLFSPPHFNSALPSHDISMHL